MIAPAHPAGRNGHHHPPTPGEIAKAITGRDYLSYSQISLFQACTLKWYFTYVEKAPPERIPAAMVLGSAIHAAVQHHLECQLAGDKQPTVDQMIEVFRTKWSEESAKTRIEYSRDENFDSQVETARRMLEAFLASPYSRAEGQTLGIEESLRISLHPEIPDLVAKVDHIADFDHQLVVTDFKTTRSVWARGTADEHADQLHLYGEAVKSIAQDLDLQVKLRFVILTKAKTPKIEAVEIKVNTKRVERYTMITQQVFKAMQSGVVYPCPSVMNCAGCPFRSRCDAWQHTS